MPNQNLAVIKDLYLTLDKAFSRIYEAPGTTNEQRLELRNVHAAARDAFWKAAKEALVDDNQVVEDILKDLKATTTQLKSELETLKNIPAVLGLATSGVRLAGALVTLASV